MTTTNLNIVSYFSTTDILSALARHTWNNLNLDTPLFGMGAKLTVSFASTNLYWDNSRVGWAGVFLPAHRLRRVFGLSAWADNEVARLRYLTMLIMALHLTMPAAQAENKPVITYKEKGGDFCVGGMVDIKVEIFMDGKVHYVGSGSAVYTQGHRYKRISRKKVHTIIKQLISSNFLDAQFPPPILNAEIVHNKPPEGSLTFSYRGRERTLGKELGMLDTSFMASIHQAINIRQWTCYPPSHYMHEVCYCWP